jgi:hypothetical protein
MLLPTVLLLDLDGTIVGDITPQVCEYEILMDYCPDQLRHMKQFLLAKLQYSNIIRPHFKEFMKLMNHKGVEIFLYTASDPKWANFIVPAIEKAVGFKLNRPLFTRSQCKMINGNYRKPMKIILKSIFTNLKRRYHDLKNISDLNQQILFIDNYNVMIQDAAYNIGLALCPTYNYIQHYDVLRFIPDDVFTKKFVSISVKLMQYKLIPTIDTSKLSPDKIMMIYFQNLSKNITSRRIHQKQYSQDKMWMILDRIFSHHNLSRFSPNTVNYINSKINGGKRM